MNLIRQIYDPALFSATSARITALLEGYLRDSQTAPYKGLPWREPASLKAIAKEALERAPATLPEKLNVEEIAGCLAGLAKQFLDSNNRLHSPHYMGHQVPPAVPLAGLFETLGAVTNQASGIYEMGPLPSAVERALIQKMGSYLGWDGLDFDAIGTHGGSVANLTAILAARNVRYDGCWNQGLSAVASRGKPAILCSAESHYSISRAAGILGIGAEQVIKAPVDSLRKLDVSRLDELLDRAEANGSDVFCVVGSACSTATGSFDPLEPIGRICRKRGIWFHVDAAHGGGLLLSPKHRHLLNGIEQADSVTWDAHKMMYVPALCTFLFYRNRKHSFQAFDQDAPYLFAKEANPTLEYDSAVRTLECTKRPLTMALWALWSTFGSGIFEKLVNTTVALTRNFHAMLQESGDFAPLHLPECNILCFRYLPADIRGLSSERISDYQAEVRRKLIHAGDFFITSARVDGMMALRVTLLNPLTTPADLEALMGAIRKVGEAVES